MTIIRRGAFIAAALLLVVISYSATAQTFSEGPYGVRPYNIAAPFVLPTLEGEWDFRANWNDKDSYVFINYAQNDQNDYGELLWMSSPGALLRSSPTNVHYFFLTYTADETQAQNEITAMKGRVDEALGSLAPALRAQWNGRLHFVPKPAGSLDGWVGDVVRRTGYYIFSIDRFQRLRPAGLLGYIGQPVAPEMVFAANEVTYFNHEWDLQKRLDAEQALVIPIIRNDSTAGTRYSGAVTLPDAATMATFDHMEIELSLGCLNHGDRPCFEWDYLVNFYLCDDADSANCSNEMGRWVTAYGREGRWVTDISEFLPWLLDGGEKRFRLAAGDPWIANVNLRLSRRGKGKAPFAIIPLWQGGDFNASYNDKKQPISFSVPEGTTAASVVALITGHGWGAEAANCAEFCNHEHYFQVNSKEYIKSFPMAGTMNGCRDQIGDGVVPNQYGTWYLGRGGWCPGQDVDLFVADVTEALTPGTNEIVYGAFVNGEVYHPVPSGSGQGFGARIDMNSYLVFWKNLTSAVDDPSTETGSLLSLTPVVPNPAGSTALIGYRNPRSGRVTIRVADALGRQVMTLVDEPLTAGPGSVELNTSDLPDGVYYIQIDAAGRTDVARVVVEH